MLTCQTLCSPIQIVLAHLPGKVQTKDIEQDFGKTVAKQNTAHMNASQPFQCVVL